MRDRLRTTERAKGPDVSLIKRGATQQPVDRKERRVKNMDSREDLLTDSIGRICAGEGLQ